MPKLPRYVQQRVSPSGVISYRFNPPQNLVDEGVVKREEYGTDLKQVRQIVHDHNKAIDIWREEQAQVVRIKSSSKVTDLINYYYMSNDFNALRIEKRSEHTFKANWAGECNLKWLYAAIRRVMGGVLHRGVRALYIHTLQHTGFLKQVT